MRKLTISILATVAFFATTANSSVSNSDAQRIFYKMSLISGVTGARLVIKNDSRMNAWTDCRNLYITKNMLKFLDNESQLAFVISHELAHIRLGHCYKKPGAGSEYSADKLGSSYAAKGGYSKCNTASIMLKFRKHLGKGNSDGVHPPFSARYNKLAKGC